MIDVKNKEVLVSTLITRTIPHIISDNLLGCRNTIQAVVVLKMFTLLKEYAKQNNNIRAIDFKTVTKIAKAHNIKQNQIDICLNGIGAYKTLFNYDMEGYITLRNIHKVQDDIIKIIYNKACEAAKQIDIERESISLSEGVLYKYKEHTEEYKSAEIEIKKSKRKIEKYKSIIALHEAICGDDGKPLNYIIRMDIKSVLMLNPMRYNRVIIEAVIKEHNEYEAENNPDSKLATISTYELANRSGIPLASIHKAAASLRLSDNHVINFYDEVEIHVDKKAALRKAAQLNKSNFGYYTITKKRNGTYAVVKAAKNAYKTNERIKVVNVCKRTGTHITPTQARYMEAVASNNIKDNNLLGNMKKIINHVKEKLCDCIRKEREWVAHINPFAPLDVTFGINKSNNRYIVSRQLITTLLA